VLRWHRNDAAFEWELQDDEQDNKVVALITDELLRIARWNKHLRQQLEEEFGSLPFLGGSK